MESKLKSENFRCHKDFIKRVEKFIEDYEKEIGVKISTTQATKIIDIKIEKKGGLVV